MHAQRKFVSLLLALVILAVSVAPAYAGDSAATGTIQVSIQNKTGGSARISLSGPASYSFDLKSGKNKVNVTPGTYSYSYKACGLTLTGKFDARKSGATLTLPKCGTGKAGGGEVKVTIKNNTGGSITIYLSGPQSYTFNFPSGTSKMTVVPGKYSYTVYGCGTSMSGTKNFKGGGLVWMFWCG